MYFQEDFTAKKKKQQQEERIKFSLKTAKILNCFQLGKRGKSRFATWRTHIHTAAAAAHPQLLLLSASVCVACFDRLLILL